MGNYYIADRKSPSGRYKSRFDTLTGFTKLRGNTMITIVDPGVFRPGNKQLPELFVDGRTRKGRNGEADSDALY
jgi:hypothetical protein